MSHSLTSNVVIEIISFHAVVITLVYSKQGYENMCVTIYIDFYIAIAVAI